MSVSPMDQSKMASHLIESQSIKIDCGKDMQGREVILTARIPIDYRPYLDDAYRPNILKTKDYSTYHSIGAGSTGLAVAAVRGVKGKAFGTEKVVLKRYDINCFDTNQVTNGYTSMLREFQNLQYLIHDNITEMKDSFWSPYERVDENKTLDDFWIVTERMDLTLSDFFNQEAEKDKTAEAKQRDHRQLGGILVQILRALDYLHERGIMHRDIKPGNIGINTEDLKVKLFDFGIARSTSNMKGLTKRASTALYQPLEVQLKDQYDWGVDIWSTGLVALDFLNHSLYSEKIRNGQNLSSNKIKQGILDVFGVPGDKYKEYFKDKLMHEVQRDGRFNTSLTTAFERLERTSETGDLNEENLRDLLGQMLCINPRRPMASVLLDHKYLKEINNEVTGKPIQIPANDHHAKNQRDKKTLMKMLKNFSRELRVE